MSGLGPDVFEQERVALLGHRRAAPDEPIREPDEPELDGAPQLQVGGKAAQRDRHPGGGAQQPQRGVPAGHGVERVVGGRGEAE